MTSTSRAPFAARMGITTAQIDRLCALADRCAIEQEDYHNTGADDCDDSIRALESFAASLGFSAIWPGLFPVLQRDGGTFHLPE